MIKFAAVVVAAGAGERMGGGIRKQYLELEGRPILARSLELFLDHPSADEVIAVIPAGDEKIVRDLLRPHFAPEKVKLAAGGATRQESVGKGLEALTAESRLVCIHDAARPLASKTLLESLLEAAIHHGAAVPVITPGDTVKEVGRDSFILSTPARAMLRLAQTPQVFERGLIVRAYRKAAEENREATDDASLVECLGEPVITVPGERSNLKITTPHDLALASILLKGADRNR